MVSDCTERSNENAPQGVTAHHAHQGVQNGWHAPCSHSHVVPRWRDQVRHAAGESYEAGPVRLHANCILTDAPYQASLENSTLREVTFTQHHAQSCVVSRAVLARIPC